MTMQQHSIHEELSERDVVNYLRRHPDFFTYHEELLAKMMIPHSRGSAISLVERQLSVLREENRHLQHQIDSLVKIAQHNELLNQRIQRLVVALSSRLTLEAFFDTLYVILKEEFNTDAAVLRLFIAPVSASSERAEFVEYDAEIFALFESVLASSHPICGRLSGPQTHFLFGRQKVASAVLIPLGQPKPWGLLAMGSQEVSRFHAGMATDLLAYMGELVGQLLTRCLQEN